MKRTLLSFLLLVLSLKCSATQDDALDAFQKRNFDTALRLWRDASDHGDLVARYRLGIALYFGRYGEKDIKRAEQLFASAANAGSAQGAYAAYVIGANNPEESKTVLLGVLEFAVRNGSEEARTWLALHQRSPSEALPIPPLERISYDLDILLPITFDESLPVAKKRSATSGKALFQAHCTLCHGPGMMGAPKIGDREDWRNRLERGMPTVIENAIKGLGAHPPKGSAYSLTNDQLREVVLYMVKPNN